MLNNFSHRELKATKKIYALLMSVFIVVYLSGCSSTSHYKLLSFFFDGVPDPAIELAQHTSDSIRKADTSLIAQNLIKDSGPTSYVHTPYQDKQCNSCHDRSSMGKLIKSMPELCYDCHEDFSKKYKVLHGPVGGGQCTMCHNTHTSPNESLLVRTGQDLCLHCHDSKQLITTETHKQMNDAGCTTCHNPHGGNDLSFLR